jgi:hypothetical protein
MLIPGGASCKSKLGFTGWKGFLQDTCGIFSMKQSGDKREIFYNALWLLALIAVTSVWCCTAARSLSATFDEPTYLECGLSHWHTGSYKPLMRLGTMPLAIDVQTLPLFLWEKTHGAKIDLVRDFAWALPMARAGTLLFWGVLLVYVFRAASMIAGAWAGRIASALVAFEPSLLGHAALATTDIAVTACLMVFVVEFQKGRGRGWLRAIGVPSLLYGVAILAKASSLVFAPLFMLVLEFFRLSQSQAFAEIASGDLKKRVLFLRDGLWNFRREFFSIVGLGLLVTFLYCGSDWTTERTFVEWAQTLKPGALHDTMLWISQHLKIFTNAGEGLAQQIKHNMRGHDTYIFGEVHRRAVWYYFPVALTMKSSVTFLLLPLLVALVKPRALWNLACLAAFVLLAYSVTCRVQIGIRFMFPLMALASAGLAAALVVALRETQNGWKKTGAVVLLVAGIAGNGWAAAAAWPDGICYTNALWGGTRNGYKLLTDSNYDWGQDLFELPGWCAKHGVEKMDVWYFQHDPRVNVPPLQTIPLHDPAFAQGGSLETALHGRCVAVGTTLLYGSYLEKSPTAKAASEFFRQRAPMDRTTTYFIYDFR